jgi:predicted RNase H-like HicB family nuclease
MKQYIAMVYREVNGGYAMLFPDFPGVTATGQTIDDARVDAEWALLRHLDGLAIDGAEIPEPSSLETIMADPRHLGALESMTVALVEIDDDDDD